MVSNPSCETGDSPRPALICIMSFIRYPLNLHHWYIQTGETCFLCLLPHPISHHVLNGCPVALQQGRYTYHHDAVLLCLIAELQTCLDNVTIFTDLDGKQLQASDSPPTTIPPAVLRSKLSCA